MRAQIKPHLIQVEEVEILKQKLKKEETRNLELTSILARLQSPSPISPPASDGSASGNFDDALNPTRISTVRQEDRQPDQNSKGKGRQD
jgi:hypothetical protein